MPKIATSSLKWAKGTTLTLRRMINLQRQTLGTHTSRNKVRHKMCSHLTRSSSVAHSHPSSRTSGRAHSRRSLTTTRAISKVSRRWVKLNCLNSPSPSLPPTQYRTEELNQDPSRTITLLPRTSSNRTRGKTLATTTKAAKMACPLTTRPS